MFYHQGGVYYLSGYAFATNAEDGTLSRGQEVYGAWLLWTAGMWVVVRYVIILKLCRVTAFTSICCACYSFHQYLLCHVKQEMNSDGLAHGWEGRVQRWWLIFMARR